MKKALFKSVMVLSSTLMLLIPFTGLADDYLYVDVNRDGEVNIADINAVIDYIFGNNNPTPESSSKTFKVNGVPFKMIKVEGGTFWMGADDDDTEAMSDERPQRVVKLSDYYIGETEVTQELWEAVMGTRPSAFTGGHNPVEHVSWDECKEFISQLNALTGQQFRLPTEAEWEFAARGGNLSNGYRYAGSDEINEVALWTGNYSTPSTQPVGQKLPNELGIYDMSGNVFEWCNDWYGTYPSPSISVSTSYILFQDNPDGVTQTSTSFSVSGYHLSNDVYITLKGNNSFTVSPQFIGVKEANEGGSRITVTYNGPQLMQAKDTIIVSSEHAHDIIIPLSYRCPDLQIVSSDTIRLVSIASPYATFQVNGYYLTGNVSLNIDGDGFSITPTNIQPNSFGNFSKDVTVSYSKTLSTDPVIGTITISSNDFEEGKTITVIAQLNPTIEIVPDGPIMLEDSASTSATFRVIGHNLIEDVTLSVEGEGFSITPTTIQPINIGDVNEEVTVSFSDTLSSEPVIGTITIKSTGIKKTIEVIAQLKADSEAPAISYTPLRTHTNVGSDYEGYVDVDPRGPSYGSYRIMRGGAWNTLSKFCRVSYRYGRETSFKHSSVGLRLAL